MKAEEPQVAPPGIRLGKDLPKDDKPVILRWQDLPEDDPNRDMIIVAPEDCMPPPEKESEKPLANYIKIGDFALACKMCPNPDWHPTFQCPNLTPELKEWLKEARLKGGTFRAFHPDDRYCHVCLSKDHWSSACPYQIELPVGATVGPFAEILCLCCGEDRPHPGVPGVDWKARVVLKDSCMLGSPEALRRAAAARGIKANTSAAASGTVLKASASKATTAGTATSTSTSTSDEYLVSSTSLSA